jgi:adenylate cyclase
MEGINSIFTWLSEHESGFSALAALVVIIGVILSPLGAGMRGLLSRRKSTDSPLPDSDTGVSTTSSTNPDTEHSAAQDFLNTPPPLITDKPSIAVLPFVNMSKDEDKEFFADGMTEDIITGLSCDSRLFVIARNSTFAYKGQSPDIRTVGKELGVRYVLEGSIRPVGDRLRITVQLIETDTGSHIWADKIDRPVAEIFDIQDDVVDRLVATLSGTLGVAEGKRARRQPPENIKAWELCIDAEMSWMGLRTAAGMTEAQALAKKATEIEPGYALGWAMLAYFSSLNIPYLITNNNDETAKQVDQLINKAIVLAPDDPTVLGYLGYTYALIGKASTGLNYLERSLASNPNSGFFRYAYANTLACNSQLEDALAQCEIFFRQSPKDSKMIGVACFCQSMTLSIMDRYLEAEQAAALGIKHQPSFAWLYVARACALSGLEHHEEAQRALGQAREIAPHFSQIKIETWLRFDFQKDDAEKLISLLRLAWSES